MLELKIFLSSPGDVTDERTRAEAVIEKLQSERGNRHRLKLHVVAWEKPGSGSPMPAHLEPQEAIAARLPAPSECDIVIVIFGYRMGTPLSDKHRTPEGDRFWSGTEYEFREAIAGAERNKGVPSLFLYRRFGAPNPRFDDSEFEEKKVQWDRLQKFFATFRHGDGSIRRSHRTFDFPTNFERMLEDDLRDEITRRLESFRASPLAPGANHETQTWQGDPYPGLAAFDPAQAPIFFGRGKQTDLLLRKLAEGHSRFIAVIGASGSGKSSLVAAGLIPRLQNNSIPGSRDWHWVRFTPGGASRDPVRALAKALPGAEMANEALLRSANGGIPALVDTVLFGRPPWAELLVFVDQFEELFTSITDAVQHHTFIEVLAQLIATGRIRIVVTMRAEFFGRCVESDDFRGALAKWFNDGSYFLEAPDPEALQQMIEGPARLKGLAFERGLIDRIVHDTGPRSGNLALMAFALEQLYRNREDEFLLTRKGYDAVGGVEGAIADRAEGVFKDLSREAPAELDRAFASVFRELVEVDDDSGVAARKRVPFANLPSDPAMSALIARFTNERLLVTDVRKPGSASPATLEVAHEALFRSWPRLREWIEARKSHFLLRKRLQRDTAEWQRLGGPAAYKWSDERTLRAAEAIAELSYTPTPLEREFLGPIDVPDMLSKIERAETTHEERATIGLRLAQFGDPRPGVGLRADRLPDIVWCPVERGHVVLAGEAGRCEVEAFWISKYPVTYRQYRAFVEAPDGFRNSEWWEGLDVPLIVSLASSFRRWTIIPPFT
ncbi:MAG: hypothetical protein QOE70_3018 [Chthoniobacter sp.]|jgi:hypothetical protein|nr:hypothetical protein [Chthoniobacter sp.]